MLHRVVGEVIGRTVRATDGAVGTVADLLFDDQRWAVRHVAVDAGDRLARRRVLIAPHSVASGALDGADLPLALTRAQVEGAPGEAADLPVSRQHEAELSAYYGWSPYWYGPEVAEGLSPELMAAALREERPGDAHLRGAREVIGYRVEAGDGPIGHVDELLVDDAWRVRFAGVATRHWLSHHHMLVGVGWISEIDWLGRSARLGRTRRDVEGAPSWDPARSVGPELEERLRTAFGEPAA